MDKHISLSPCPFCGNKTYSITRNIEITEEGRSIEVGWACGCAICDVHLWGDNQSDTESKWNTRPIEDALRAEIDRLKEELKYTDDLLKEATETIGAVVACCTYNSNNDAKIGIYGIDEKAFTKIDQFITHYNDAVSAGKVSVDVKTSTDNNKRSKWKAYVPGWGAPAVNKRYLVKLINDWITIATYYLRVGGGYWKDDKGQELADGVVSLWKGLEE